MTPWTVHVTSKSALDVVLARIRGMPLGWTIHATPEQGERTPSQNSRMWADALRTIAEQAWVDGRQYAECVWHEYLKRAFLPEDNDPELALLVRRPAKWRKWAVMPGGERVCVGSTTGLTKAGMARYMEQVYAHAAENGVLFEARGYE